MKYLSCHILPTYNNDAFDHEGWAVGVVVRANQYYLVNESEGAWKNTDESKILFLPIIKVEKFMICKNSILKTR